MALLPGGISTEEGHGAPRAKGCIRSWKPWTWRTRMGVISGAGNIASLEGIGAAELQALVEWIINAGNIASATAFGTANLAEPGMYDWFLVNYADRLYPWKESCGIPGGIPTRTVIYATLPAGSSTATINATTLSARAVYLSTGIGQVVALSAGSYTANSVLFRTGVTIIGAGPGVTTLNTTGTAITASGPDFSFTDSTGQTISNGTWLQKGSYSVTLSSALGPSFQIGNLILINQDDDHIIVFPRTGNWAGTRNLRHVSRITGINGNAITFDTPIPYTFSYSLTPRAQAITPAAVLGGVENLSIVGNASVNFMGTDRCWVYKVEARGFAGDGFGVTLRSCHRSEIRRCYLHDAVGWPAQSEGASIYGQYAVGNILVEDCIGYHDSHMMIMNGDTASAYINNYSWGTGWGSFQWIFPDMNCNHGPHCIMSLWEGNMLARWQNDTYHGSASHQTLFRNNIHGRHPSYYADRWLVDMLRASYYFNAVGNVLGDSTWNPTYYQASKYAGGTGYYTGDIDRWTQSCIWRLGYPCSENGHLTEETALTGYTPPGGTYPDSYVYDKSTPRYLLRHGNYDYYNHATVWDPDITSHAIPNSLFHTAKPAYFGSLSWPNVGPDVSGLVRQTPSMARWLRYDPAQGGNGLLPTLFADEGTAVDLYLDWHTGSDGNAITSAIAAGSCRPTSPPNVPGVYPGSTLVSMRIETDSKSPVPGYVSCGGTLYNIIDAPQGAIYDHSQVRADVVTANVPANVNVMSMGFMFRTGLHLDWAWYALSGINASGEWAMLAPRYFSGQQHLYMHTSQGYSANSIDIQNSTWYWITIQYNRTTMTGSMAAYLASTMAKVGPTVSLAFGASAPVSYWQIGQGASQGNSEASNTWYGPAVFNWTTGAFPLLPA